MHRADDPARTPETPFLRPLKEAVPQLALLKGEIDRLLCDFVEHETQVARGQNPSVRARYARALWEVAAGGAEQMLAPRSWAFCRLRAWLGETRRKPEFKSRLEALGFPSANSVERWKSQLKQRWEERIRVPVDRLVGALQPTWTALGWLDLPKEIFDRLDQAVGDQQIDDGLEMLRRALQVRTDWEDALTGAFRNAAPSPRERRMVVGLYPPGYEDDTIAAAFGVERALGTHTLVALDEDEESLVATVDHWSAEPAPGLVVVPCLERFEDIEAGLERLAAGRWDVLLFAQCDRWFESSSTPIFVRLVALADEETAAGGEEPFRDALDRSRFASILRTASLFSAHNRKLLIDQVARACQVNEDDVRAAVDDSHGLLAVDADEKVVRADQRQATRYVARTYPTLGEKANAYRQLFARLDANRPEDARAVRNIFSEWLFASPPEVRLGRRVLLSLRSGSDGRDPMIEFARAGPPDDTKARLRWTQILSWLGEHQAAHDLLLDTDRSGDPQQGAPTPARIEKVNARVFVTRYRATGRTQFLRLACLAYESALGAAPDVEAPGICEELALVQLLTGKPEAARELLARVPNPGRRWRMLSAAVEAQTGNGTRARETADRLEPWLPHFELAGVAGSEWHAYVRRLLDPEARPGVEALQQAAERALERGHFADVRPLLQKGLSVAPDNAYLAATHAKLLHEQGRYPEAVAEYGAILSDLVGDEEHALLRAAWLDSKLEGFRAGLVGASRIRPVPRPLENKPKSSQLALSYWLHLVALEVKAHWYDAVCPRLGEEGILPENRWKDNLSGLCAEFLGLCEPPPPALLTLASKIQASGPSPNFERATEWAQAAVDAAREGGHAQDLIVTLNTLALIRQQDARARSTNEDRVALLGQARSILIESTGYDLENSYTLVALAGVLEALGAATGNEALVEQAAECERQARTLRGESPD